MHAQLAFRLKPRRLGRFVRGTLLTAATLTLALGSNAAWQPASGPLLTRWAKDVSPGKAHPEYPRPQMVRRDWLNLNGLWDYAIAERTAPQPTRWDGQILVPFPIESALSGVMKPVNEKQRLWYRRTFQVPGAWKKRHVLLHFGAVDWEAQVWVNGQELGFHRGGYDGFGFDITPALKPADDQEIVVAVWDPTDAGYQPRGKQVRRPNGIWYTPTTGIWQTAWLEPVAPAHVESLRIVPDIDAGTVQVAVAANNHIGGDADVSVAVFDGARQVQAATAKSAGLAKGPFSARVKVAVPSAKLWTPDRPFLYDLKITLRQNGKKTDEVRSYFGMRKTSLGKDAHGTLRLCLNNQPLFQFGPLDQGFWPDGIYTAPTDEALRFDIEMTRKLGFNLARKHVKIEPDRWYYWADKLGLLVWQDMPSGDKYIGGHDPDIKRSPESAAQFEQELRALIDGRGNHPCIVMWVPYNEGWGQWDTPRIVELLKSWDPTRLVNNASGWTDRNVGDVLDVHSYPGPAVPPREPKRAIVLGEFGGLGLPVKGHTWQQEKNWGYRSFKSAFDLTDAYVDLIRKLRPMTGEPGLSAAVYTQTTDCEIEVNGLMTYDRALVKMDAATITAANKSAYAPPPPRRSSGNQLAPPATPLVACDPYFSIWSPADKLTDADTVHWTGRPHRLTSMVRIDSKTYRVMGASPASVPALEQTDLRVLPTSTYYRFGGAGVELTLVFTTPALPDDLDVLSRPVTYVTWGVKATDGKTHDVAVYFDAAAELTVNDPAQHVVWAEEKHGPLLALKLGSRDQPVLAKKGDDLRIDWGYLYVAADAGRVSQRTLAAAAECRAAFASRGTLPETDARQSRAANDSSPVAAMTFSLRRVGAQGDAEMLFLAYDDLYSIQYLKKNLRPYWRRTGWEAADLLQAAANDYATLLNRCAAFDAELMADLTRAGGEQYAKLCALAYRQCFAAGKFVADDNGQPLQFCKENHSNGCIGTSDVFYPMAPQFLLFGPTLAKSFLVPFMNYAASARWKFPFAPHDLGTYPHANGQVYGDGERGVNNQMPVEESGNLLCLFGAVAQLEGNANFAGLYWQQLQQWAEYLKEKGFDPENQLCTDDFAGHLAHNVNLSAKAICGLGAFAKLCDLRGDRARADEYSQLARGFAQRWVKEADDGGKFRLAFDRPGTWSQKYNLIWDRILGLNLFPRDVARKEMDFYRKMQNPYGLPLDNRQTYTKLDWITWTATLTQNRADFEALIAPIFRFMNETPDRAPLTDWYQTKTARKVGFTGRPVIGGVFAQMLYDQSTWAKYAGRDKTRASNWAPLPIPPVTRVLVATAENEAQTWRYTTARPAPAWFQPDFDDSSWPQGPAGFGTEGTPGAHVRTLWNTADLWLRRTVTLPDSLPPSPMLRVHHDEDVEIYVNGILAATATSYTTDYEALPLTPAAKAALKPGQNLLAAHCHQTGGGQYLDLGLQW
jgi:hypothetical protein